MMILFWNVRGLNSLPKKALLWRYFEKFNMHIVLIQEIKIDFEQGVQNLSLFQQERGIVSYPAMGALGGLALK